METWVGLMMDAGFDVEKRPYLSEEGHHAHLFVGTVK
jgi:hypothetical protein